MQNHNFYKLLYKITIAVFCVFMLATSCFAIEKNSTSHVDIDLTRMSSTMVYSMVFKMVTEPTKFVGKRIKMKGVFSSYQDEETGRRFFGCVIKDALACCSQGLAFETATPRKYPKEYPSNHCAQHHMKRSSQAQGNRFLLTVSIKALRHHGFQQNARPFPQ